MVYKGYKFYGPYSNSKDGRLRCILIHKNSKKQTVSYPKYLMEVHLGRYLKENETIDHIDGNFLNNNFSNLRVIERKQHCIEDVKRNKDAVVECAYCHKLFTIKGNELSYRNRKDRHQSGYFCSKICSGKYGKEVQLGLRIPITIDRVLPVKYRKKDIQKDTGESNCQGDGTAC